MAPDHVNTFLSAATLVLLVAVDSILSAGNAARLLESCTFPKSDLESSTGTRLNVGKFPTIVCILLGQQSPNAIVITINDACECLLWESLGSVAMNSITGEENCWVAGPCKLWI